MQYPFGRQQLNSLVVGPSYMENGALVNYSALVAKGLVITLCDCFRIDPGMTGKPPIGLS